MLKIFQRLSIAHKIKSKYLTLIHIILHDLTPTSSTSSSTALNIHFTPAILASSAPDTGQAPYYLRACILPGMLHPIFIWLAYHSRLSLNVTFSENPSLTTQSKVVTQTL